MRRRLLAPRVIGVLATLALGGCNLLTGASDIDVDDGALVGDGAGGASSGGASGTGGTVGGSGGTIIDDGQGATTATGGTGSTGQGGTGSSGSGASGGAGAGSSGPMCGDAVCDAGETCASCEADCGACATCGNAACEAGEDCMSCPSDCGQCSPTCGDMTCAATETCNNCAVDCAEGAGPATTSLDSEEAAFLVIINDYRAQNGLGALSACTSLNRAAQGHSEDMRDQDYFSHTGLDGSSPWERSCDACYALGCGPMTAMAENIAAGNSGAAATFNQWKNSPGHNANMLGASFTVIGIGRATGGGTYGTYWTNVFGGSSEGSCN